LKQFVRVNNQIKANEVRVIDESGKQVGILPIAEALNLAKSKNLDLIEISPTAQPPVCKIQDFGKFLYKKEKEQRIQKARSKVSKIKSIRLSFGISDNDIQIRAEQAKEFLEAGHKVRADIILKGREKLHKDLAIEKIKKFISFLPFELIKEEISPKNSSIISVLLYRK